MFSSQYYSFYSLLFVDPGNDLITYVLFGQSGRNVKVKWTRRDNANGTHPN
jgi:hypothetical protein